MSSPVDVPESGNSPISENKCLGVPGSISPIFSSTGRLFNIPSPIITKRTRTLSSSERAASNPTEHGKVKYFCRERGHGFITPDEGADDLFFHISDIDGEFVPESGDEVTYKKCLIPPKNEKLQAVHVVLTHLAPGSHERWDKTPGWSVLEEVSP